MPGVAGAGRVIGGARWHDEAVIEALYAGAGRHGGDGGAPEGGGAFVVAASLLKTGGEAKDHGVLGILPHGDAQPGFGLGHVSGSDGGGDGALEVADTGVVHVEGLVEGDGLLRTADARVGSCNGETHRHVVGIILRRGLQDFNATHEMATLHGITGAAHSPIGPECCHLLALICA